MHLITLQWTMLQVKRKKSVAAIARGLAPPPELPPGITLQSRSRSSKVRLFSC